MPTPPADPDAFNPNEPRRPFRIRKFAYTRGANGYVTEAGYASFDVDPTGVEIWVPRECVDEVSNVVQRALEERARKRRE